MPDDVSERIGAYNFGVGPKRRAVSNQAIRYWFHLKHEGVKLWAEGDFNGGAFMMPGWLVPQLEHYPVTTDHHYDINPMSR